MLTIGCHLSTTKGFKSMGTTAVSIGANTFAFFTRNPRGGSAKAIDPIDLHGLRMLMADESFGKLVAHAPYTMNLCSSKEETRAFARQCLADDLVRMEQLPGQYYNFHPGSHTGLGSEQAIEYIVDALDEIMKPDQQTTFLLETMAGKGTEVGRSFEELKAIIDGVAERDEDKARHMGVCLDTCHVYDAGYDIVNDLDGVLEEFDSIVGIDRLCAMHLNDSKNPFSSHKDRHECIGEGSLGIETFKRIVNHPVLKTLPLILETPQELPGYAREIELLRSLEGETA